MIRLALRKLIYFTIIAPLGLARDVATYIESTTIGGERAPFGRGFWADFKSDARYHFVTAPKLWFDSLDSDGGIL